MDNDYFDSPFLLFLALFAFFAGGVAFWGGWEPGWLIFFGTIGFITWRKRIVKELRPGQSVVAEMGKEVLMMLGGLTLILSVPIAVVMLLDLPSWSFVPIFLLWTVAAFLLGLLIAKIR